MSKTTYIMATDPWLYLSPVYQKVDDAAWRHSRKKQRLHSYLGPNDSWVLTKFDYIEVLLYLLVIGEKKCSSSRLSPNMLFRQKSVRAYHWPSSYMIYDFPTISE